MSVRLTREQFNVIAAEAELYTVGDIVICFEDSEQDCSGNGPINVGFVHDQTGLDINVIGRITGVQS